MKVVNIKYSAYDVYIGRGSKWGNPFRINKTTSREDVIQKYEEYLRNNSHLMQSLIELKDKILGCHCYPKQCHGDVLIKLYGENHGEHSSTKYMGRSKRKQKTFGFL